MANQSSTTGNANTWTDPLTGQTYTYWTGSNSGPYVGTVSSTTFNIPDYSESAGFSTIWCTDKECNCCKKTKTCDFITYTNIKITRYICKDCFVIKMDKLFGIKGKNLEDTLYKK